jgi:poly-gamma-glutamate synthesis protein (capsule biosynthesis protein)
MRDTVARRAEPAGNLRSHDMTESARTVVIFLCGDVMTGRGIDQVLPFRSDPSLHERFVASAARYVEIAERASGPIPRRADFSYPWGCAIEEFERLKPDLRVINLETSITQSGEWWRGKEVHYRMHPGNAPLLSAAGIDVCALANNHALDWGYDGLADTLRVLDSAGIRRAGAGIDADEAATPAVIDVKGGGRVLVVSLGAATSGIPPSWGAGEGRPGVNFVERLDRGAVGAVGERIAREKRAGDVVVASVHWGGNWGYGIDEHESSFASSLMEEAGVDIVHGHSSHHVRAIGTPGGKLVLYGCGDFINDYEGIRGNENYRGDLGLMYFASVRTSDGKLAKLLMAPTKIAKFSVNRASEEDTAWLVRVLNREGKKFGTRVVARSDGLLELESD